MRISLFLFFTITLVANVEAADGEIPAEISSESILVAMNEYRASNHLGPLRIDSRLRAAAEDRLRDMEEQQYWSHESPDGGSPFRWLTTRGYRYAWAGENLARGFETTGVVVASWMESLGHRENILGEEFSDVGIAILDGSPFGRAAGKSIVVLFGRETEEPSGTYNRD